MLAVPTMLPVLAAMTTVPLARAVTSPALLTEAMASLDDDHLNNLLEMATPPEPYAVAVSCTRSPTRRVSAGGLRTTAWTTRSAGGGSLRSTRPCGCRAASARLTALHFLDLVKPTSSSAS